MPKSKVKKLRMMTPKKEKAKVPDFMNLGITDTKASPVAQMRKPSLTKRRKMKYLPANPGDTFRMKAS